MRRFSVGEVVTWIPDLLLRSESHGEYRVVATMPDRDGDHMYRIKSPLEEYERVVKEDLLGNLEQYPLLAERVGCSPRTKVSPRSGAVLTPGRRLRGRLHDATQTTPVSALKRAQARSARAEPAGGCCSRGSSCRS